MIPASSARPARVNGVKMRGAIGLTATVLLGIGVGVGVLALNEEPVYQLGSHAFAIRFPLSLSSQFATVNHHLIEVHGLVSPPDFRVSLAEVSPHSPAPRPLPDSASEVVVVPSNRLAGGQVANIPGDPHAAHWLLTPINGFVREVDLVENRGYWSGNEIAFDERSAFLVSATSASFEQVRTYLDSFVPIA